MAFETADAARAVGPSPRVSDCGDAPIAPPACKFRLRFRKAGDLRLVSHIDLLHCFERLLRRAALPFACTQGFHPKPKIVFAQALALGVVGVGEVVELEVNAELPPEEVLARLNRHAPPGIAFTSCTRLARGAGAQVRRAFYRLSLAMPVPDLPERCAAFLAKARHVVTRTRPRRRSFDLRPYVAELAATPSLLTMALWLTPHGAARPEEVAAAVGVSDPALQESVCERTHLEIIDELPETERWLPPLPRSNEPVAPAENEDAALPPEGEDPPRAARGLPQALIPNPLSFDS